MPLADGTDAGADAGAGTGDSLGVATAAGALEAGLGAAAFGGDLRSQAEQMQSRAVASRSAGVKLARSVEALILMCLQ